MTLRQTIIDDVSAIFLNLDDFAETIIYHRRGGGSKMIKVIIDWDGYSFFDPAGNVVMATGRFIMDNACETGVQAADVDTGGDEISVIQENGQVAAERRTVLKIIHQDLGTVDIAFL